MLDLKLFWAVGVKLMYENFHFPLGKKTMNDYIIRVIETKNLI
jgi:hypothetical protein